jgi:hypothetical protein
MAAPGNLDGVGEMLDLTRMGRKVLKSLIKKFEKAGESYAVVYATLQYLEIWHNARNCLRPVTIQTATLLLVEPDDDDTVPLDAAELLQIHVHQRFIAKYIPGIDRDRLVRLSYQWKDNTTGAYDHQWTDASGAHRPPYILFNMGVQYLLEIHHRDVDDDREIAKRFFPGHYPGDLWEGTKDLDKMFLKLTGVSKPKRLALKRYIPKKPRTRVADSRKSRDDDDF